MLSLYFSGLLFFFTLYYLQSISDERLLRKLTLSFSGLSVIVSFFIIFSFKLNHSYFQNIVVYSFQLYSNVSSIEFGLDGISIFFYFLSNLLIFLSILFIWNETFFKSYAIVLFFLNLFLILVFAVLDLLFFYVFFEAILIPMYVMIGIWGSRERKVRAAYLFFFYTLFGSLCMLTSILYLYSRVGCLNYQYLCYVKFSFEEECWLWLTFFLSFASKVPVFPFHIWLPEAHVEAPTVGSVILAGILLKLGVYGFLRYNVTIFPNASIFFSPFIFTLCLMGVLYGSLCALRQSDLKRIIAYSSVAHMNLVTMGIFATNLIGIQGCVIQSISHGFVSAALFFLIGILYNRYHTRQLIYFGGLVHTMPLYSSFFLIFTLANVALPGTSNFIGEFLLLLGVFKTNIYSGILATTGVILSAPYSLWLYNRICFGNLKTNSTIFYYDLELKELFILIPLCLGMFIIGVYPQFFLIFIQHIFLVYNFNFISI